MSTPWQPDPDAFDRALRVLNNEHLVRLGKVTCKHELRDLGQLRAATEDCMRDYYFEPAIEPVRPIDRFKRGSARPGGSFTS